MALDEWGPLCKFLLTFFNKIVQGTGVALVILGFWLRSSESTSIIFQTKGLDSSPLVLGVLVMIVLGSVMVIVATIGDYGILKSSIKILRVFAVLLVVLIVAELAVGVRVYSRLDEIRKFLEDFYTSVINLYDETEDPDIAGILIYIRMKLECCGGRDPLTEITKRICNNPEHKACTQLISEFFGDQILTVLGIFGIGAVLIAALVCTIILLKWIKIERERTPGCFY